MTETPPIDHLGFRGPQDPRRCQSRHPDGYQCRMLAPHANQHRADRTVIDPAPRWP